MHLELSVSHRQAGTACGAGTPLTQGLRRAASGCLDTRLPVAAEGVERRVRSGCARRAALSAHLLVFRGLKTAITAADEDRDRLDGSLLQLAEWNALVGVRTAAPSLAVLGVEVGEKTGDFDRALEVTARLHREDAERAIRAILILLPIVVHPPVALCAAVVLASELGTYARIVGAG